MLFFGEGELVEAEASEADEEGGFVVDPIVYR